MRAKNVLAKSVVKPQKGKKPKTSSQNSPDIITEQPTVPQMLQKLKKILRGMWNNWIRHLLLFLALAVYTSLGAAMFMTVEGDQEMKIMKTVWKTRDEVLHVLWDSAQNPNITSDQWEDILIEEFMDQAYVLCTKQAWVSEDKYDKKWTYGNAVRFSSSVYFAIGYGDLFPVTDLGRAICIIYALLGIPFVVVSLQFYGNLFSAFIFLTWTKYLSFYYSGKLFKRKLFETSPAQVTEEVSWIIQTMAISYGALPERKKFEDNKKLLDEKLQAYAVNKDQFEMPLLVAFSLVFVFVLIMAYLVYRYLEDWTALEVMKLN